MIEKLKKLDRQALRRISKRVLMIVVLWLVIFEIPFFFTPLRFPPQEITVYRYGESVTLTCSDREFYGVYFRLRNAGKGTIAHIVAHDLLMASHKPILSLSQEEEFYHNNTIVVYLKYDSVQKAHLWGGWKEKYDQVAFVVDKTHDNVIHAELYKRPGDKYFDCAFANYGSLDRAAKYVEAMDFSKFS